MTNRTRTKRRITKYRPNLAVIALMLAEGASPSNSPQGGHCRTEDLRYVKGQQRRRSALADRTRPGHAGFARDAGVIALAGRLRRITNRRRNRNGGTMLTRKDS
jgi:hypothetical protein